VELDAWMYLDVGDNVAQLKKFQTAKKQSRLESIHLKLTLD